MGLIFNRPPQPQLVLTGLDQCAGESLCCRTGAVMICDVTELLISSQKIQPSDVSPDTTCPGLNRGPKTPPTTTQCAQQQNAPGHSCYRIFYFIFYFLQNKMQRLSVVGNIFNSTSNNICFCRVKAVEVVPDVMLYFPK